MELIKAIILGIIQGLTEFLPVSSSGHLVIASQLMDFQEQGVVFDVCVHLGTLLAVCIVFRREIAAMCMAPFQMMRGTGNEQVRDFFLWDLYVVLATLPAVVVGLFFKERIELLFTSTLVVYFMLIVTGVLMISSRYLPQSDKPLNWTRSLFIGCAQACAILPGLSRSGSTIFAGMLAGVAREKVARFSFIMSIPAILGAAVLQLGEFWRAQTLPGETLNFLAGAAAAAVAGYLAIKLLLDVIRRNRLQWFGYYCLAVALIGLTSRFILTA